MTPFQRRVYELCEGIPEGKVSTYGIIAERLQTSPRAVGQALKNNPCSFLSGSERKVPCHRVVKSDGSIGGFMGSGSGKEVREKIALLEKEGVRIEAGKVKDFFSSLHK